MEGKKADTEGSSSRDLNQPADYRKGRLSMVFKESTVFQYELGEQSSIRAHLKALNLIRNTKYLQVIPILAADSDPVTVPGTNPQRLGMQLGKSCNNRQYEEQLP